MGYQSDRSWESFQWRERLSPRLKMAAQLLSLLPEDPSRVERLLNMEPGTLLKLWEENEYFRPAATEYDSDDEVSNWEAIDFEQGLTPQQMQAAHLYYIDLLRQ